MNIVKKTIELSDGRVIEIETGKLAKQADGSVVVKMGGTMLLATVTCAKDAKDDVDFMPLQVDYKEKYASAGRFPGGFMKRAVLFGMPPLFPTGAAMAFELAAYGFLSGFLYNRSRWTTRKNMLPQDVSRADS